MINGVKASAPDQHPLAAAEVERVGIELLAPCMAVAVGEEEEEPFHLDALAVTEKLLHPPGSEVHRALHDHVCVVERGLAGEFVQKLQIGALRR